MPCDSPVSIFVKGQDILVPCGKCPPCKIRRVNEWVYRLMWEEEHVATSSHFVTLTYDTKHVPLSPHGYMTLMKSDLQKFFKRLRKLVPDAKLTYFACGEYGSRTYRPHYHAIIFNVPDVDFFAQAWSLGGEMLGQIDVGTVTSNSVAYTLKYIDKQSHTKKALRHARDDREFEFQLMSKGIGVGYLQNKSVRQWHKVDLTRNYVVKRSGHKVAMPRYYRKKLYTEDELDDQRQVILSEISKTQEKERRNFVPSPGISTYADLKEKEREGRRVKFAYRQKLRSKI